MPAAIQVDKEQVRMLVMSIGVREAARQMGLNENTVLGWSNQGQWLQSTKTIPASDPLPASQVGQISPIKPADVLKNVLEKHEKDTRLCLSTTTRRLSQEAAKTATLADAPDLQALAKTYALVHRIGTDGVTVNVQANIGFFEGTVG